MKDININDLLYYKGKHYEWFLEDEIDSEVASAARKLLNKNIFSLNWRTSMGVTLEWKYVEEHLKGAHIIKDYGKYKSVFLDFMDSKLQRGCENKPENYSVIVFNDSVGKVFYVPHIAIMAYWMAGWPRCGWNPGRYVIEPWDLLKPVSDFLDGKLSYKKLLKHTEYEKYITYQNVFEYTYNNIFPLIRLKETRTGGMSGIQKLYLAKFFKEAVRINNEEFKARYNPGNRFTGPLERTFPLDWFDDPEKMKNPFLRYYKKLRTDYAENKPD